MVMHVRVLQPPVKDNDEFRRSLSGRVFRVSKVDANDKVHIIVSHDGDAPSTAVLPHEEVRPVFSKRWNQALNSMLEFLEALFASFPPLTFRFPATRQKPVIIYTDASCSDEYAGIGAVVIDVENDQRYISAAPIDKALRRALAPNCAAPIDCLELLAVLCTMLSFRDVIRNRKVLLFVDNTSAISALIHGYTASPYMGPISNAVHFAMALLQCEVHVEYVPSAANPADIPSRSPRGRTQKQEILEAVQVDQPSNQRLFQIPSIGHLQDAQAARTAMADLCSV